MSESDKDAAGKIEKLRKLFQETQGLSQTKTISDEMIVEEIEKMRSEFTDSANVVSRRQSWKKNKK
jgi:hypothetical protein